MALERKYRHQSLLPRWDRDALDSSWLLPTFPPLGPLLLILGGGPGAFEPVIFSPAPRGRDIFATLLRRRAVLILIRPRQGSRWLLPGLWTMGGKAGWWWCLLLSELLSSGPVLSGWGGGGLSPRRRAWKGAVSAEDTWRVCLRSAGVQVSLLWHQSHE